MDARYFANSVCLPSDVVTVRQAKAMVKTQAGETTFILRSQIGTLESHLDDAVKKEKKLSADLDQVTQEVQDHLTELTHKHEVLEAAVFGPDGLAVRLLLLEKKIAALTEKNNPQ